MSKSVFAFLLSLSDFPALSLAFLNASFCRTNEPQVSCSSHHSLTHSFSRSNREREREGEGERTHKKIWDELKLSPLCVFIGPRASVENSSNIYCFYNASKFFALIDGAFTGPKSLSQSQTPLRDGERSKRKRGRK